MALKMKTSKKIAIFFTSIPREKAVEILKHFSIKSMESIASEIRNLGMVPADVQNEVFQEISEKLNSGSGSVGGEEVAKKLLDDVLGEAEAARLLERAKPRKPKPFSGLANVSGADLAAILSNEQTATAAIILGFFPPKKVADVLNFLSEDMRQEIIVRLAQDKEADNDIVERIEEIFMQRVSTSSNPDEDEHSNLGGPDYVAELFQNVDKQTEEELMGAIQEESPELADRIRELMFKFEDIIKLSDVDVQKVLREVPMDKLVVALRGAGQDIYDKFMNNLSKRARENLNEEMALLGRLKKSQIEAERKTIVGIVRALEVAGEITLSVGAEEDVYV